MSGSNPHIKAEIFFSTSWAVIESLHTHACQLQILLSPNPKNKNLLKMQFLPERIFLSQTDKIVTTALWQINFKEWHKFGSVIINKCTSVGGDILLVEIQMPLSRCFIFYFAFKCVPLKNIENIDSYFKKICVLSTEIAWFITYNFLSNLLKLNGSPLKNHCRKKKKKLSLHTYSKCFFL